MPVKEGAKAGPSSLVDPLDNIRQAPLIMIMIVHRSHPVTKMRRVVQGYTACVCLVEWRFPFFWLSGWHTLAFRSGIRLGRFVAPSLGPLHLRAICTNAMLNVLSEISCNVYYERLVMTLLGYATTLCTKPA